MTPKKQRELHDRAVELHALAQRENGVELIEKRLQNKNPPFILVSWYKTEKAKAFIDRIKQEGMTFSRFGPSEEMYFVGDPDLQDLYIKIYIKIRDEFR